MKKYDNYFRKFHPASLMIYFVSIIATNSIFNEHEYLIMELCIMAVYAMLILTPSSYLKSVICMLPVILFMMVVNTLFNHSGKTILLYINDRQITLEAMLAGLFAGILILCLLTDFIVMGMNIDRYKFTYLFGRILPTLSLMTIMIIGFIPYFGRKLEEIKKVQSNLGVTTDNGNRKYRIRSGKTIFNSLISISLDGAMDTSDSMTARGFTIGGRTHYKTYRFHLKDVLLILVSITCTIFLTLRGPCGTSFVIYIIYLLIPIMYNGKEAARWAYLTSKI